MSRGRAGLVALVLAACSGTPGGGGDVDTPGLAIVVDANRDGTLDLVGRTDDAGKDAFSATAGAVVLANLDDDDADHQADAATPIVDGADDVADLSPVAIRGLATVAADASGTLSIDAASAPHVRLFRVSGPLESPASYAPVADPRAVTLAAADLRNGALFALESTAFAGAADDGWDGVVRLTLDASAAGALLVQDAARLRVAPLLFQWNTLPTRQIFHTDLEDESAPLEAGLVDVCAKAECRRLAIPDYDPWAQDFFDVAHATKPGPGGAAVGMRVVVRSAQPDRKAGKQMLRELGPGTAVVEVHQAYTPATLRAYVDTTGYSMNSFGNWEVVPPHSNQGREYPLGRGIWGRSPDDAADFRPDPAFERFVTAQAMQPPIHVDTSWLVVGHVDEFFSWVSTNTPRGWGMLAARPSLARKMLLDLKAAGHGGALLFEGLTDYADAEAETPDAPAQRTVDEVLANPDLLATSQAAEAEIDLALETMRQETGLAADEITPMPFLFTGIYGAALGYQPGTVNLLHADGRVVVPKPFGPKLAGVDPFEKDLLDRLGALGLQVRFADDWYVYHINMGEVHCGTNVTRDLAAHWWESGR